MGYGNSVHNRNIPGNVLTEASLSGTFLGLSAFFAKLSLGLITLDLFFLIQFLLNPISWLAILFGILGFLLFQKALHDADMSIVTPLVGGLSIVYPIVLALIFLGETVSVIKWIGIAFILIGVFWLGGKQ